MQPAEERAQTYGTLKLWADGGKCAGVGCDNGTRFRKDVSRGLKPQSDVLRLMNSQLSLYFTASNV